MSNPLTPEPFAASEFATRRSRALSALEPGAMVVIQGAPPARGFRLFRQTNEFHYFCGVEAPQAVLAFGGSEGKAILFLPEAALEHADVEALKAQALLDDVLPTGELVKTIQGASVIVTPFAPAEMEFESRDQSLFVERMRASDPWDTLHSREMDFVTLLRVRAPRAEIRDLSPVIDEAREVKSPAELARCRRAGQLAAQAVKAAMKITKPGVTEAQLYALAIRTFLEGGARGEGYRAIIPSGANMWEIHYGANDRVMQDGEIVLMDAAPDFGYYTSDIGRIWPVNGTYAPWQRELYGFVVTYHKTILGLIRAGATAESILKEAAAKMLKVIESTKFSKPEFEQGARKMLDAKGHLSHPVGMAVHDVGNYWRCPLRAGTVFTVDPQMWVPEDKLYIRVEDTIAVTETGVEVLTAEAPLELDDVEATVRGAKE